MKMRPEAFIASTGLATPPLVSMEHYINVSKESYRANGMDEQLIEKFERACVGTRIRSRSLSGYRYHVGTENENVEYLGRPIGKPRKHEIPDPGKHSLTAEQRAALWNEIAPELSLQAAREALKNWKEGGAGDITHVVTTNTSGWREPGIAAHLIHSLDLSLDTQKCELNFNGCFCEMTCLRLARDIVRAGEDGETRAVLVVASEFATLHSAETESDLSSIIAMSLFSDGAGAFVVATKGEWAFSSAGMSLIPDSQHLLGMVPHSPPSADKPPRQCYAMGLHPDVPVALGQYFATGAGNQLIRRLTCDKLPALAVHPGGPRILDALSEPFRDQFGFSKAALLNSYETLFKYGNLGCTAILFVLAKVFATTSEDSVLSLALQWSGARSPVQTPQRTIALECSTGVQTSLVCKTALKSRAQAVAPEAW